MEPTETTVTGTGRWIAIGVVGLIGVLLLAGLAIPDSRAYIIDGVKLLLGAIPSVSAIK